MAPPIPGEGLEAIARRDPEIVQSLDRVELIELPAAAAQIDRGQDLRAAFVFRPLNSPDSSNFELCVGPVAHRGSPNPAA